MRTDRGQLDRAWIVKTGRPARPFDEYHPKELLAFLFYEKEMDREIARIAEEHDPFDPDGPIATGDPVADEWEKAIARGDLPDWMKEDDGG